MMASTEYVPIYSKPSSNLLAAKQNNNVYSMAKKQQREKKIQGFVQFRTALKCKNLFFPTRRNQKSVYLGAGRGRTS